MQASALSLGSPDTLVGVRRRKRNSINLCPSGRAGGRFLPEARRVCCASRRSTFVPTFAGMHAVEAPPHNAGALHLRYYPARREPGRDQPRCCRVTLRDHVSGRFDDNPQLPYRFRDLQARRPPSATVLIFVALRTGCPLQAMLKGSFALALARIAVVIHRAIHLPNLTATIIERRARPAHRAGLPNVDGSEVHEVTSPMLVLTRWELRVSYLAQAGITMDERPKARARTHVAADECRECT